MDLLSSWPWQILLLTIIKIILVHHLTNLLYLHNIKVCLIRLTAYSQVNYPFQKMLHLFINLILSSLFEYPICIAAVISSQSLLSTVNSPIHRLYPLSTYFTPLSTYFILLSTNLISLSTYFTPLSTDFILLSTSPPSYLRLDPCLECLDEIAKVSASWLILNSKRNTQNISSSASLCLSRLLVYMCVELDRNIQIKFELKEEG